MSQETVQKKPTKVSTQSSPIMNELFNAPDATEVLANVKNALAEQENSRPVKYITVSVCAICGAESASNNWTSDCEIYKVSRRRKIR